VPQQPAVKPDVKKSDEVMTVTDPVAKKAEDPKAKLAA
jgi:hypothetical protein